MKSLKNQYLPNALKWIPFPWEFYCKQGVVPSGKQLTYLPGISLCLYWKYIHSGLQGPFFPPCFFPMDPWILECPVGEKMGEVFSAKSNLIRLPFKPRTFFTARINPWRLEVTFSKTIRLSASGIGLPVRFQGLFFVQLLGVLTSFSSKKFQLKMPKNGCLSSQV